MKQILSFMILILTNLVYGQSTFPNFLQGTWRVENQEIYEHWDKLNDHTLKGLSYKMEDGRMIVSEYLEIVQSNNEVIYTAIVINQNQNQGIEFKLTQSDSTFVFENMNHDFPKKIVYQQLSENGILVQVSDGKQQCYDYKLIKQQAARTEIVTATTNPNYDKALAERLDGDDYGMKSYFLVILKTGTNTTTDEELIGESFRGHLDNINKLVKDGQLIVAGPLMKNENSYRGIFILDNISSMEDARELLQTDPAIKNSLLDYEIYNWYGSAALPEYLPASDKVWKLKP